MKLKPSAWLSGHVRIRNVYSTLGPDRGPGQTPILSDKPCPGPGICKFSQTRPGPGPGVKKNTEPGPGPAPVL